MSDAKLSLADLWGRTPPNDGETERAVLGCMMLDPNTIDPVLEILTAADFYDIENRAIYEAALKLHGRDERIDALTLRAELARGGKLEKSVLPETLLNCGEVVPSVANAKYYAGIVHELGRKRRILEMTVSFFGKVDGRGADALLVDLDIILDQAREEAPKTPEPVHLLTPKTLLAYNTVDDPNTLIGKRYLCRACSLLFAGATGLGKTTLAIQFAIAMAMGESLFGIVPARPLRSLFIQAENDDGDLADMFRGIVNGMGCADDVERIESFITFITDAAHSGDKFHPFARALIEKHRPDLVWIDPLYSYLGGNVSDQQTVSAFLRNGLGAIAQETGVCWMIIHHTNKPPKDPAMRNALVASEYSYLGAGSAELANWARAVLVLREVEDGVFELRAAKRGTRAGLVDAHGNAATEVYLKHSTSGICWERGEGPEDRREEAEGDKAGEIVAVMEPGKDYNRTQMKKLVADELGLTPSAVVMAGRKANRVFEAVLALTCDHERAGMYHCNKV